MSLRKWRLAKKLTQDELAAKLKIDGQFVSNIERGVSCLPPKHFRKISEILDVPLKAVLKEHLVAEEIRVKKAIKLKSFPSVIA
jgi:transcriptional regulator with XRE-family HTH domain